jgi:hypothetical protein
MASVDKIIIRYGEKNLELTEPEAQELRDVLNRIFQGMTFIPIVQPCPPQCPYQPTYPVYPEITWGGTGTVTYTMK